MTLRPIVICLLSVHMPIHLLSIMFLPMVPLELWGPSDGIFPSFSALSFTPQTFGCKDNICGQWVCTDNVLLFALISNIIYYLLS